MTLAVPTFDQWRTIDLATARRIGQEAAGHVGGRLVLAETVEHLGGPLHRVRIERDGQDFALIPGGTVRLGFDLDAWQPTPSQAADYAESLSQGFGNGPDLKAFLAGELSPVRSVTVAGLFMAVEDEEFYAFPDELPGLLAARGLRMPSADEWEHACGAGADTLFRWGSECPLGEPSYGGTGGVRHEPNAFGLHIAYDSYGRELSSDWGAVHGGDGGEAACGGYGALREWLPLATAHRNPGMAEFLYGPDAEDEDPYTRPVITLS
ncbi:hypothetical protein ABZX75_25260 [Streptomyces sp. NPDC003038]|uniref:hypothetical protein n=1 Tax=unclassified Streptomyces TaxID=2593676 RepID=UPI0033A96680